MNPSCNLFLIGATGAGKTSIGRQLAAHYGLLFVDVDQEIERHTGVPVSTVFEIEGETGFRRRESAVLVEFSQRDGVLLAAGAGAVLNADNRRLLSSHGYVVWLQTTIALQLERLAHDTTRPLLAHANRDEKLASMASTRTPLYQEIADVVIPGNHEGVSSASKRCIGVIDQHWKRVVTS